MMTHGYNDYLLVECTSQGVSPFLLNSCVILLVLFGRLPSLETSILFLMISMARVMIVRCMTNYHDFLKNCA